MASGRWSSDYHDNREALGAILRAVPPEMLRLLAVKVPAQGGLRQSQNLEVGDRARPGADPLLRVREPPLQG
jgi:hypothetical protein